MNKLGMGIRLICTSVLGFIGGVFMMSKHREHELDKRREELIRVAVELKKTKELLNSKDQEASIKIEEALENEREKTVDNVTTFKKRIKTLEDQVDEKKKTE